MKLLNHLFRSEEDIAKEILMDEESIVKHWKHYLGTISEKKEIIGNLHLDNNLQKDLRKLKDLLALEIVDISFEEKEETELIAGLGEITHSKKINIIHRLEQCLRYAETKHEYVYSLLHHLHSALDTQMKVILALLKGSKEPDKLKSQLKSYLELEMELLNKINAIGTFHDLFLALVNGEHIIKTLNSKERKMLKKMGKNFFSDVNEGTTYEWIDTIYKALEAKVQEGIADESIYPSYDADFQFVNGPNFEIFVRGVIKNIRERSVSEEMISVFVQMFRESFNDRD